MLGLNLVYNILFSLLDFYLLYMFLHFVSVENNANINEIIEEIITAINALE